MMLSLALVAPQTLPVGETSPWNRQLSRPGDSSSRSRSFTSTPPAPASGGSGQASPTRSAPIETTRPPPVSVSVLGEFTTKVWVQEVAPAAQAPGGGGPMLPIGGSPVAMSSKTKRPAAGYSGVSGRPIAFEGGQFGIGKTLESWMRPYPCSLLPMTPMGKPPTLPRLTDRDWPTSWSLPFG